MFGFIVFICLVILLFSFYYIPMNIQKLNIFNKIEGKLRKWIISFIPIILLFFAFDVINSIIVIIHLFFILLLINLINKLLKNRIDKNICVIISVCLTIIYLGYGLYQEYNVRETKYEIKTNKLAEDYRIIQISDAHMGTTFDVLEFEKYIKTISKKEPDMVVITGDFIDDSTSVNDIISSCEALGKIESKYGVYFVFGNHDEGYYNNTNIKEELIKNNIHVLEDEVQEINNSIYIVGRKDKRYERKDIKDLVSDLDKSKYIIDLNHQPNDYENEKNNVDLVLSGHTHGGQLFPLGLFDKLLNIDDEYYGLHKRGNTNFIVSSGISNWALHFKTGTYSEYVIIDIKGNKDE